MGFDDRLFYTLLGSLIGFVLGYVVRTLQDIRDELSSLDENVKKTTELDRANDGFLRYPVFANVALFLVLALTAFAAFASQRANNEVEATQERIERVTKCNHQILTETIEALNERTTYARRASDANVSLQRAQADTLRVLLAKPPRPSSEREAASRAYFDALTLFLTSSKSASVTSSSTDYPKAKDLEECLVEEER